MISLPFLSRTRKPAPVTISPVDAAITAFLDALMSGDYVDYATAYEACAIARTRGCTRPVDIWTIYHNALAWS